VLDRPLHEGVGVDDPLETLPRLADVLGVDEREQSFPVSNSGSRPRIRLDASLTYVHRPASSTTTTLSCAWSSNTPAETAVSIRDGPYTLPTDMPGCRNFTVPRTSSPRGRTPGTRFPLSPSVASLTVRPPVVPEAGLHHLALSVRVYEEPALVPAGTVVLYLQRVHRHSTDFEELRLDMYVLTTHCVWPSLLRSTLLVACCPAMFICIG
jgi:hypothetical protein